MADTKRRAVSTKWVSYVEPLFSIVQAVSILTPIMVFVMLEGRRFLSLPSYLISKMKEGRLDWDDVILVGLLVASLGGLVWGARSSFRAARQLVVAINQERARKASVRVAAELDKLKGETPVAEISTQKVADSLKGTKVADDQLARLVEQRKQQLLIDDDYFREELQTLIVDYLQPLPRNAKRLLNRFRVNLLIAHSRGLLTSEPKVTAQQIGKWLVLIERWPQLGRSLSAVPEKMKVLEEQSPAPPSVAPLPDAFMQTVKLLAEPYFGDEDLRKFIHSAPPLAVVLPRLVHYGSSTTNS